MQTDKTNRHEQLLRARWEEANPGLAYTFLDDGGALAFLRSLGAEYALAFQKLLPGAMRSDLLRLAWLYKHGGFYADVDKLPSSLANFTGVADLVLTMSEPDNNTDFTCQGLVYNAFMAAVPGSRFIKSALDVALARVRSSFHVRGQDLLKTCYAIAGPLLLGEKLCQGLPRRAHPRCSFHAGEVRGPGCRAEVRRRLALRSGETVFMLVENRARPTRNMGLLGHYSDECRRDRIYNDSVRAALQLAQGESAKLRAQNAALHEELSRMKDENAAAMEKLEALGKENRHMKETLLQFTEQKATQIAEKLDRTAPQTDAAAESLQDAGQWDSYVDGALGELDKLKQDYRQTVGSFDFKLPMTE